MSEKIPADGCRKSLAVVWFLGAGFIFVVLLFQSISGKVYGEHVEDAWSWFLPTIMPTLSMIIGVLVLSATGSVTSRSVDRFFYRLTLGLSVIYLLTVALTILAQPLVNSSPLELMTLSNLWLGPMQGLVAATLTAFFVKGT